MAGAVTVGQLREALGRNRRLWKEPPPEGVLLEFCRDLPGVRIEGKRIVADPPRDWRTSLTGVEWELVNVLRRHGPAMERGDMEDICVREGMNRFSFHAFVSWSPVIVQLGHSVYGLVGRAVSDAQIDELLAAHRANRTVRRVLDSHGWTDSGKVWLSYRLSKAASTYAVITVPAALKNVVRGRFALVTADGRRIGALATKDGRAWGLGAFLRQHGARIDDRILLTLDLPRADGDRLLGRGRDEGGRRKDEGGRMKGAGAMATLAWPCPVLSRNQHAHGERGHGTQQKRERRSALLFAGRSCPCPVLWQNNFRVPPGQNRQAARSLVRFMVEENPYASPLAAGSEKPRPPAPPRSIGRTIERGVGLGAGIGAILGAAGAVYLMAPAPHQPWKLDYLMGAAFLRPHTRGGRIDSRALVGATCFGFLAARTRPARRFAAGDGSGERVDDG